MKVGRNLFKAYFRKHNIDNISVKNKLLLIYILCVLVPVILTNIIFLKITGNNVKKQQIGQIEASLIRTKVQLYKDINDGYIAAYNIVTDRNIKNALDKKYSSIEEFYQVYNGFLRDALTKNNSIVSQIGEVNIYTENTTIPDSSGYKLVDDEVKKTQWYKAVIDNPYEFSLVAYEEKGKKYFSLIKALNNFGEGKKFNSILKIDFRDSEIINTLSSEKISGEIYLVNENNQIIYTSDAKYRNNNKPVFPTYGDNVVKKNDHIFKTNLDKYRELKNWNLILIANEHEIISVIKEPIKLIVVMALINLFFAFIVIYIISSSFKYRLKILSRHIKKVRKQNYEVIDCREGRDEIGEVIVEFNHMAVKIQELIMDVYEVSLQKKNIEIERRQAEINALQSQINPHFLFNVLESIRMRSVIKKEVETAQIIKYVSKMFRRLLIWGNDMITVKEEIEYIEDFLKIQKYRFGDKVQYEFIIDVETLDLKIPKMIFQPIVENSCLHGIEGKREGGKVTVEIKRAQEYLICSIIDDGTGINEIDFNEIVNNLDNEANGKKGIGIKNVYNRLKLIYEYDFKFKIDSSLGKGTSVLIIMPANEKILEDN